MLFLSCFVMISCTPAGKRLTSWLSFLMSNCDVVTFPLVPMSGVVLDCIDSLSLPSFLLSQKPLLYIINQMNSNYILALEDKKHLNGYFRKQRWIDKDKMLHKATISSGSALFSKTKHGF